MLEKFSLISSYYPSPPPIYPLVPTTPPMQETRTEKGLKFMYWGYILGIFGLTISVIGFVAFIGELFFGIGMPTNAVVCGGVGILAICGILLLAGAIYMVLGRNEYGPEHAKFVIIAIVLLIGGFIISIAGSSYSTCPTCSTPGASKSSLILSETIVVIGGIIGSLEPVFLILKISDSSTQKLLWVSWTIVIIGSVIALGAASAIVQGIEKLTVEATNVIAGITSLKSIGSLISFIILVICYGRTYNRVKNREIQPYVSMPPPPTPYTAPPPQYVPPPPPQYPPPPRPPGY